MSAAQWLYRLLFLQLYVIVLKYVSYIPESRFCIYVFFQRLNADLIVKFVWDSWKYFHSESNSSATTSPSSKWTREDHLHTLQREIYVLQRFRGDAYTWDSLCKILFQSGIYKLLHKYAYTTNQCPVVYDQHIARWHNSSLWNQIPRFAHILAHMTDEFRNQPLLRRRSIGAHWVSHHNSTTHGDWLLWGTFPFSLAPRSRYALTRNEKVWIYFVWSWIHLSLLLYYRSLQCISFQNYPKAWGVGKLNSYGCNLNSFRCRSRGIEKSAGRNGRKESSSTTSGILWRKSSHCRR